MEFMQLNFHSYDSDAMSATTSRPVILILGPTAGGKTRLAIDLAQQLPGGGECISCDSMQVYQGMDIGTAKPTAAEQARTPHHLLDVADPRDDSFSVDRWLALCHSAIADIRSRNKWPIIVGGTNLYVQAFLFGLADMPQPNAELRDALQQLDNQQLRQWLERVDPEAARRIHPNDRKRTIRAIEVFEQAGKPLSAMQQQWNIPEPKTSEECEGQSVESAESSEPDTAQQAAASPAPMPDPIIIGLDYPTEVINRRINARVKAMIEAGFVDEVRRLHESGCLGRNAREALGYKQILEHFEGKCSLDEAIEQIKIRTRRFAKQQRTWLRRFRLHPHSTWLNAAKMSPQELADKALTAISTMTTQLG